MPGTEAEMSGKRRILKVFFRFQAKVPGTFFAQVGSVPGTSRVWEADNA